MAYIQPHRLKPVPRKRITARLTWQIGANADFPRIAYGDGEEACSPREGGAGRSGTVLRREETRSHEWLRY